MTNSDETLQTIKQNYKTTPTRVRFQDSSGPSNANTAIDNETDPQTAATNRTDETSSANATPVSEIYDDPFNLAFSQIFTTTLSSSNHKGRHFERNKRLCADAK